MDLDNLQSFYGLFSQYRFHIPDYQRGYAWEESQWKALMDDLSTLTNHNDHFTGLLVLHETADTSLKIKTKGVTKEVFDVVDGQQRLTTIVILLNVIRQEMEALDCNDLPEIAQSIVDTYLYEPGQGNTLVPKLILDRNNHEFFKHNILKVDGVNLQGAEIQSHKNLIDAQTFFQNYFVKKKNDLGEAYPGWLETLYEKIANQMKIMVYKLRSEADAGVVFESMNNRGKKPNRLDLVKNYLLYLASKLGADLNRELTASINQAWEVIFKQLSSAKRAGDEETLLQMHWLTVYDHDLKHWDQEREKSDLIKRRFSLLQYLDRYDELYKHLQKYVHTLMNAAIAYCDLRSPVGRSGAFQIFSDDPVCQTDIIYYSEKLLRFNIIRPFQPLLIAVRLRFPNEPGQYLELVQLCERYAFRVFGVAEHRASSKESVLFRLANMFYNEKISFSRLCEELRRDLLAECPDSLFQNSFAIENAVPWYGKRGLIYFLYEYEEHLFGQSKPIINWQSIAEGRDRSIEHILPQHPEEVGYWAERFTEEERQQLVHQIGNLTLVLPEVNSALGRKSFPEKKGKIGQAEPCYVIQISRLSASWPV